MKKSGKTKYLQAFDDTKYYTINILRQIGWKKQFINTLIENISNDIWKLYEIEYTYQEIISDIFTTYFDYNKTLDEILKDMKKSERKKYKNILCKLENNCYSNFHLIDIITEHALGVNNPITLADNLFLYNEDIVNLWFEINEMNIYNAQTSRNIITCINVINSENDSLTTYYHATSWKNAINIINYGPECREGRKCLDFGIYPSFYCTMDINMAIDWLKSNKLRWFSECAIVIFRLPKITLAYKYFEDTSDEWKELTTLSRLCKQKKNLLDEYDFVYGASVANPNQVRNGFEISKPHNPPKFQLASKNTNSDKFLKQHMFGIIFLNKQFT